MNTDSNSLEQEYKDLSDLLSNIVEYCRYNSHVFFRKGN